MDLLSKDQLRHFGKINGIALESCSSVVTEWTNDPTRRPKVSFLTSYVIESLVEELHKLSDP